MRDMTHLLNLPEGANVGKEINDAITDIEKHNPHLAGVLPRTYQIFNTTPRAYSKELYGTKCTAVFEHVYESYQGEGKSVYSERE